MGKEKPGGKEAEPNQELLDKLFESSLRLIGPCPNREKKPCGDEDCLVGYDSPNLMKPRVKCEKCEHVWPMDKVLSENKDLRQTRILRGPGSVYLSSPRRRDIPEERLVTTVLNTAVMERFGFQTEAFTEGGFGGRIMDKRIEFSNIEGELGLYDNSVAPDTDVSSIPTLPSQPVMSWYLNLLKAVFQDALKVGDKSLGRAAILKLDPKSPTLGSDVFSCLMAALAKIQDPKFAESVRKRIERSDVFDKTFLAGLTPEAINRLFVAPSGTAPKSKSKTKNDTVQ